MNLITSIGCSTSARCRKLRTAVRRAMVGGALLGCLTDMPVFSQGLVSFGNTVTTKISTNAVATGGGAGVTGVGANLLYCALLTAPSTVTTIDSSLQQLLTSTWTFTGLYATNTLLAGRLYGGSAVPATGWAPGATNSYIVVGWSAGMGTTWSDVAALLDGAIRMPAGGWFGGGLIPGQWLGASAVAFGQAGGVDPVTGQNLPAWSLFGSANAGGSPISSGFVLYTWIPEPSTGSLMLLGAIALAFRRGWRR